MKTTILVLTLLLVASLLLAACGPKPDVSGESGDETPPAQEQQEQDPAGLADAVLDEEIIADDEDLLDLGEMI